ncbi:unnamed protein product [Adineta steineri]|uniref:Uncharacterized protein n=1 Tax=Adineta steineri TaxID=433720 RepID=A0A818P4D2_9BILA|nr:unnamed protein product [Adineta steineri]CAF3615116.1 unnamed protein product [Adineta steineri]
MFKIIIYFCLLPILLTICSYIPPKITIQRLSKQPIISYWSNQSQFRFNYNSAFLPLPDGSIALVVRVQDLLPNATSNYDVGPSKLAIVRQLKNSLTKYEYVHSEQIIIDSDDRPYQVAGVEDPRITIVNGTYYLYYTAVYWTPSHEWSAHAALATCQSGKDPTKKENWILHPALFPELSWSKAATLLIHNATHQYVFFNESNIELALAVTDDYLHYEYKNKTFIEIRSDYFDSELVEPGPEPQRLSDGNYLFLYNSARRLPLPNNHFKPDWDREYNLGWVIMDGNDPTKILARSDRPVLAPELDWERCDFTSKKWARRGLTPRVVFAEGWKKTATNQFILWYQGCDTVTGIAKVIVEF